MNVSIVTSLAFVLFSSFAALGASMTVGRMGEAQYVDTDIVGPTPLGVIK